LFSSKKSIVGITLTLSLCKVKIVTLGSKYSNNSKQLSHYSPARHLVTLVTIYDNTTYGGDSGAVFAIRKCYTFAIQPPGYTEEFTLIQLSRL